MVNGRGMWSGEDDSGDPPPDYQHVSMFLSVQSNPWEVFEAINESAANPAQSRVDMQIEKMCRKYSTASEEQRVLMRRHATNGWSLLHYTHRMAIRAMRTEDADCIRLGLLSLLLECGRSDPRETITCLAMLYHAASRIKCSFSVIADEINVIATPGMAERIQTFQARDPGLQSLKAFALREAHDDNGPRIDVGIERKR